MKKYFICLLLLTFCTPLLAGEAVYNLRSHDLVRGWHLYVQDADIDSAAMELITTLATTYAQLAVDDYIQIVSSSASDETQTVTVTGIAASGKRVSENLAVNKTNAVDSSTVFKYITNIETDIKCVGVITVRRKTGATFIASLAAGALSDNLAAQYFTADSYTYLTGWSARVPTATGDVTLELRWYPDAASSRTDVGYVVLDRAFVAKQTEGISQQYAQPIRLSPGGWLAAYGQGSANDCTVSVVLQGFNLNR